MFFVLRRAIDDIETLRQHRQQFGDLLGRMLQIVIHGDDHVILRGADAAQQRIVLAIVAHQVDGMNPGMAICQLADYVPASVRAAVVDQHQFVVGRNPVEHSLQALDQFGQDGFAAVNRHHHREPAGPRVDAMNHGFPIHRGQDCGCARRNGGQNMKTHTYAVLRKRWRLKVDAILQGCQYRRKAGQATALRITTRDG